MEVQMSEIRSSFDEFSHEDKLGVLKELNLLEKNDGKRILTDPTPSTTPAGKS